MQTVTFVNLFGVSVIAFFFSTIAILGVFFAGANANAWVEAVLLAVVAVAAILLLVRKHLSGPEMAASGLLMATNLSFIVVAVTVGLELHAMRPVTGSALIVAGLLSAILFPALAGIILKRAEGTEATPPPGDREPGFISPM